MTRFQTPPRRRGIATFLAVGCIGLVGVALLAISVMLRIEHRRTRTAESDARIRHLILAGLAEARATASSTQANEWKDVSLPPTLSERGARVTYRFTSDESPVIDVLVATTLGDETSEHRFRLADLQSGN